MSLQRVDPTGRFATLRRMKKRRKVKEDPATYTVHAGHSVTMLDVPQDVFLKPAERAEQQELLKVHLRGVLYKITPRTEPQLHL